MTKSQYKLVALKPMTHQKLAILIAKHYPTYSFDKIISELIKYAEPTPESNTGENPN